MFYGTGLGLNGGDVNLYSLRNLRSLEINKNGEIRDGVDSNVFFRKEEIDDWKNHLIP